MLCCLHRKQSAHNLMPQSLFRTEALEANAQRAIGRVHLATPISFLVFLVFTALAATALVLFVVLGSYTRKARVTGQLVPQAGLIKVVAPQAGTVTARHASEGQWVRRGQRLYTVTLERSSAAHGNTQAAVAEQLRQRRKSLATELEKQQQITAQEETALRQRLVQMRWEFEQLASEIENQQGRVQLAEQSVKTFRELVAAKFVSSIQAQQKIEELIDQKARLKSLERSRTALERDIGMADHELRVFPLKARQQRESLERMASTLDQEMTENEARREITVVASQDGQATNVLAEAGQFVMAGAPLLSIVPSDAILEAHLYAPSRAIGFVQPGASVLLRYQTFPYQKFGQHTGQVQTVSRTAQAPQDYVFPGMYGGPSEPLYRITVGLSKQHVLAYGQPQALQPGMVVDANVLLDRRRIYEWILDPLYSVLGKV